jgi:hypothetical protein
MAPLLGIMLWEHILMTLMLEHFEDEQWIHEELNFLITYA